MNILKEVLPAGLGKILLAKLIPDPKNPRKDLKDGDPEYEKIRNSIDAFQQLDPIVFNTRTRKVIGGHQRLKVLFAKGYNELYTVQLGAYTWAFAESDLKELTETEEQGANIALNKAQGDWQMDKLVAALQELKEKDFDIGLTGFDEKEFDGMLRELHKDDEPQDTEPQISRAEELRKIWKTELGQMWQCGEHRVICGDCTDPEIVGRVMQGEKADMVFTDPPYGVSYGDKNKYLNAVAPANRIQTPIEGDHLSAEDTSKLWIGCWKAIYDHLKIGCSYYCCSADADLLLLLLLLLSLRDNKLPPHQCVIWVKNNIVLGRRDYKAKHETIVYGWKEGKHTFYGPGGAPTVWEVDKPHSSKLHPTMKPVEIPVIAIQNSSKTEDIVLDPFLGSGTTMIACENLGRKCRGCEIDPGYVAVILQRYKDTFPDKEIKLI